MSRSAGDPWAEALAKWTASPDGGRSPEAVRRLSRVWISVIAALGALLVAATAVGWTFAYLNGDRAGDWKHRSESLQQLVGERTEALNNQTRRLNISAKTLRKTRAALVKSETDVKSLSARQIALANEKAQVEDQRAQLVIVAASLTSCNGGLRDILTAVANGVAPTVDVPAVAATCDRADSQVAALQGGE